MTAVAQEVVSPPGLPRGRLRRFVGWLGRLLAAFIPVFLLASLFTFLLGTVSGRSPAVIQLGENATPEAVAAMNAEWGLDRPWIVQYFDWLGSVLTGDFGISWATNVPVGELLAGRAAISLSIAGVALLIGVLLGSLLGALAAQYHGSWFDRGVTVFTSVISVMPPFIVGIALIAIVAVRFEWLPAAGYIPFEQGFWPWLSHIILPAIALSLDTVADMARLLRAGLLNTSKENYVTGAVVRGLSPRRVFFVHTLRNGVGPAIAVLGLKFPNLLGGAVVTESIFQLAGYGLFSAQSAVKGDVPAVQAVLVVAVILVVVFNMAVNSVLAVLNPASKRGV
ncbi:ABC transporter permease [Nocardioides dubius]|uniref:ABC transporter permease n=1 Tax=Nocardioides dubius TaxID=317019 RepID=A0ABN1TXY1_9ACTN